MSPQAKLFRVVRRLTRPIRVLLKRLKKRYRLGVIFPALEPVILLDQILAEQKLKRIVRVHGLRWNPKFLFVHIPKCGGTSVLNVLTENIPGFVVLRSPKAILRWVQEFPGKSPQYLSLDHVQPSILIRTGLMSREDLSECESFSLIREKESRLVSCYHHHRRHHFISPSMDLLTYRRKVESKKIGGTEHANIFGLSHARPQEYWLYPTTWTGPKTVLQLEEPEPIEEYLANTLGVTSKLPRLNTRPPSSE